MKKPGIPESDLDNFLEQTLKDDLPPETEARMNQSFSNLKRVIDRPEEFAAPDSRSRLGAFLPPHRWLWVRGSFRKEVLVFSSAVMLLLGVALHLGGYQSALAHSISRLKVVVAVAERLHRATSMDCTMLIRGAVGETSTCRVRWSANGVTRMDMALSAGAEQTLWISDGKVSMVGPANRSMRTMAITAMPQNPALHAALEFLTPAILTRRMEE